MLARRVGVSLVALAVLAGGEGRARAWECGQSSAVVWPDDGAVDVPLDSVIVVVGGAELGPITLRDSADAREVPTEVEVLDENAGWRLLRPVTPLRANATHELSLGDSGVSSAFTTGSAHRPALHSPASLRSVEARVWVTPGPDECCHTWSWSGPDAPPVDAPARGGFVCVELEAAPALPVLELGISPRGRPDAERRALLRGRLAAAGAVRLCGATVPWLEAGAPYDARLISHDATWEAATDGQVLPLEVTSCLGDGCDPCAEAPAPPEAAPAEPPLPAVVHGGGMSCRAAPGRHALGPWAVLAACVATVAARCRRST